MTKYFVRFCKNPGHYLLLWVTGPFIYSLIIPTVVADLFMTVYQVVCFPVYGIPKVKRSDYVIIDRGQLKYLDWVEKFNCVYCGYANGVAAYAMEIAARTEWYWCPIKHNKKLMNPHPHYEKFMDYGDNEDYRAKWRDLRTKCRACESGCKDPRQVVTQLGQKEKED